MGISGFSDVSFADAGSGASGEIIGTAAPTGDLSSRSSPGGCIAVAYSATGTSRGFANVVGRRGRAIRGRVQAPNIAPQPIPSLNRPWDMKSPTSTGPVLSRLYRHGLGNCEIDTRVAVRESVGMIPSHPDLRQRRTLCTQPVRPGCEDLAPSRSRPGPGRLCAIGPFTCVSRFPLGTVDSNTDALRSRCRHTCAPAPEPGPTSRRRTHRAQ